MPHYATSVGRVYVESRGAGPTPLLAITPIGTAWLLTALPAELDDLFTIHVAELPGTGRSDGDPTGQTIASMATAVRDLAATYGEPVLFGHSMNGTLALAAAATVPLAGAISVASTPSWSPADDHRASYLEATAEPERKRRAAEIVAVFDAASDDEKLALREQYDRLMRWYDLDVDTTELDALATMPAEWIAALFADGANFDFAGAIGAVTCPVLLALGRYDFIAAPVAWTDANTPRNSTIEIFDRSAHSPFVEQPQEFVAAVERWLKASL